MSSDIFIKKALFGGFKKEDVLNYIEKLQSDHINAAGGIRQKDEEIAKANSQVQQLEDRLAMQNRKITSLAKLNDEYCEQIHSLEQQSKELDLRFESIESDCNRLKNVEAQIGMLLLDAVLYSDKMTEKAKKVATNISNEAKKTIIETADDVSKLSSDIAEISGGFSKDITDLVSKIESLSSSLSLFANRFDQERIQAEMEKPYAEQESFSQFFAQYQQPDTAPSGLNENDNKTIHFGRDDNESNFLKSIKEYNEKAEETNQSDFTEKIDDFNDSKPDALEESILLIKNEKEADASDSSTGYIGKSEILKQNESDFINKEETSETVSENTKRLDSDLEQNKLTVPPSDFDEEDNDVYSDDYEEEEYNYSKFMPEINTQVPNPEWNDQDMGYSNVSEEANKKTGEPEPNESKKDFNEPLMQNSDIKERKVENELPEKENDIANDDTESDGMLEDEQTEVPEPIETNDEYHENTYPEPAIENQQANVQIPEEDSDIPDHLNDDDEQTEKPMPIESKDNRLAGVTPVLEMKRQPAEAGLRQEEANIPNDHANNNNQADKQVAVNDYDSTEPVEKAFDTDIKNEKIDNNTDIEDINDNSKYEKPIRFEMNRSQINEPDSIKTVKIDQLTKVNMIDDKLDFAHPFEKDYAVYQEEKMARSEAEEEFIEDLIYSRKKIVKDVPDSQHSEEKKAQEGEQYAEEPNNEPAEKELSNEEIEELLRMFPDADDYETLDN